MKRLLRSCHTLLIIASLCTVIGVGTGRAEVAASDGKLGASSSAAGKTMSVDANVALASLVTIADGHLLKIADELKTLATRGEVVAGNWQKIKPLLKQVGDRNVPATMWFALPSGQYRTVQKDQVNISLRDRPYFARALEGRTVIGPLVVARSTGKNVAIVAVPVFKQKQVVGILGSSVHLDKLSELIRREMALPGNTIFYSFDATPLVALNWDPGLIFNQPKDLGDDVDKAFRYMLTKEQGAVTYSFRDKKRDVIFKKSPVSNWWYAFGMVE